MVNLATPSQVYPGNQPAPRMASYSHKRLHSMTTRSRASTYSSPAVKRPRTNGIDATPSPSRVSSIESLPTEILQLIFFASLNGNLLRAAPRIAAKLSGSRSVYRTAFLHAFYHPYVPELRNAFNFDYLLANPNARISSWEVRSMQKIVLDSRWCTCGWFNTLAFELIDYAYKLYRCTYATEVSSEALETLDAMRKDSEDALNLGYRGHGGFDASGQYVELIIDPFDLSISIWPDETEDEEDFEDVEVAIERATQWHLQIRSIGSIPLFPDRLEKSYQKEDPFRLLFDQVVMGYCGVKKPRSTQISIWEYLERAMLDAISRNQIKTLGELLQIDYFFWPEDAPYKLSPCLFVAAARQDDNEALYLLFQIDPTSLPREQRNVRHSVRWLQEESLPPGQFRSQMCAIIRQRREDNRLSSEDDLKRLARLDTWAEYAQQRDEAIIHYVQTGCLMRKVDPLSPDFFMRTQQTYIRDMCDDRIFQHEEEWLKHASAHTCNSANNQKIYDSDLDDVELWDDPDLDSWPDINGLDLVDDNTIVSEDDYHVPRRFPPELDWISWSQGGGDDWLLQLERREDYHYMMP